MKASGMPLSVPGHEHGIKEPGSLCSGQTRWKRRHHGVLFRVGLEDQGRCCPGGAWRVSRMCRWNFRFVSYLETGMTSLSDFFSVIRPYVYVAG
eukprot:7780127-Ditylum_brightwellii.AAC.1